MSYQSTGPIVGNQLHSYSWESGSNSKNALSSWYRKITDGQDIEGFYKKLRAGDLLPVNDFNQSSYLYRWNGGGYNWQNGSLQRSSSTYPHDKDAVTNPPMGDFLSIYGPSPTDHAECLSNYDPNVLAELAVSRLGTSTFDATTFLAELDRTARMFVGVKKRLINLLTSTSPRDWANAWLEGRYGWAQLVYDFQNLSDALKELEHVDRKFWSERAGMTYSYTFTRASWVESTLEATQTANLVIRATAGVRGTATATWKANPVGFNLINTAWELIPFSFVVDWFIGIGNALSRANFYVNVGEYVSGAGYHVTYKCETTFSYVTKPGWTGSLTGNATYDIELTKREPVSGLSLTPRLQFDLSYLQIADLVALITQRTSK